MPLTAQKVLALGAGLKHCGYRLATSYLDVYKGFGVRAGQEVTQAKHRLIVDTKRSCERGMGGAQRALPLPLDRLAELPSEGPQWPRTAPVGARNMIVAGSWFMLREIEASTAMADALKFTDDGRPKV